MRDTQYRLGEIVHLKSGSPRMTVERITAYPPQYDFGVETIPGRVIYDVVWVVYGTSEVKRDSFHEALLVPPIADKGGY